MDSRRILAKALMLCELVRLFVLCSSVKATAAPLIPKTDKKAKPPDQTNKQKIEHLITSMRTLELVQKFFTSFEY